MKSKRFLRTLTVIMLGAMLVLAGCGQPGGNGGSNMIPASAGNFADDGAGEAADLFLTTLTEGRFDEARSLYKGDLSGEPLRAEDITAAHVCEMLGISEEDADEATKNSAESLADLFLKEMFRKYEIEDVVTKGNAAGVSVKMTRGFDVRDLEEFDPQTRISEEQIRNLYSEHLNEIPESGTQEEQEEVLYKQLFPIALNALGEEIAQSEGHTEKWDISLENKDGTWIIDAVTVQ